MNRRLKDKDENWQDKPAVVTENGLNVNIHTTETRKFSKPSYALIDLSRERIRLGMMPQPESYNNTKQSFTISDVAWQGLQEWATCMGYNWGTRGNVSRLLEALGQGILEVNLSEEITTNEWDGDNQTKLR